MAPVPVPSATTTEQPAVLKLRGEATQMSVAAFPDLETKGYTVVPGVIPRERAAQYVDEMYTWLESFGRGFDRNDESTWKVEGLPKFDRGGIFHRYGIGHEQFVWDIRTEPGIVEQFAKIWGTSELLCSYDSANMSLPLKDMDAQRRAPWPHADQSARRQYRHCVQGIANLLPNGPKDGGLRVLEGSVNLFEAYFQDHAHRRPEEGWPAADYYTLPLEDLEWFYERGCKWVKVEAEPGDLILWDSRTIHYGAAAEPDAANPRFATYVCYKPARDISPEHLALKKECFDNSWNTSHDPVLFRVVNGWKLEEWETSRPRQEPVLDERQKKLAGLVPYEA